MLAALVAGCVVEGHETPPPGCPEGLFTKAEALAIVERELEMRRIGALRAELAESRGGE